MYNFVKEIPEDFVLVKDSQDINSLLDSIGSDHDRHDYGCLFVKQEGNEITEVYGCYQNVAYLEEAVDRLFPRTYFTNHYKHCGEEWQDTWDCACNDECPICGAEIEPYESEEIEE